MAIFLSALVYNLRNLITSLADLVQMMNNRNDTYTTLSQSWKKGFLLLTDLPFMVAGFPYVTSLLPAFIHCSWIITMHLF